MPLKDFHCPQCGETKELLLSRAELSSNSAQPCSCGTQMEPVLSSTAFQLKGTGWARDGYSSQGGQGGAQ